MNADWLKNPISLPEIPKTTDEDLVTTFQYDALDREIWKTESTGKVVSTAYDKGDRAISRHVYDADVKLQDFNADSYRGQESRYDQWGRLTHEANPFVAEMLMKAGSDATLKEKIWQTFSTRHTYDVTGLRISTAERQNTTDTVDHLTYFFYDAERRPIIKIAVLEDNTTRITEETYNIFNEIEVTRHYAFSLPVEVITLLKAGMIKTDQLRIELGKIKNDQKDAVILTAFDKRGKVIQTVDPEGYETSKKINAFGECEEEKLTVEKGKEKITVTHLYEPRGLEIVTTKKASDIAVTVTREFDSPLGKQTKVTDESTTGVKRTTQVVHDRLGRERQLIEPANIVIKTYEHDALHRISMEKDALYAETHHTYHQKDRLHTITYPEKGTSTIIKTSVFTEKTEQRDALGNSEEWQHAPDGQVRLYRDQLKNTSTDTYNLLGWHVENANKRQTKTLNKLNHAGEVIQTIHDTDRLKLTMNFQTNLFGYVIQEENARGVITNLEPDRNGQVLVRVTDPVSSANPSGVGLRVETSYNGLRAKLAEVKGDAKTPAQLKLAFQLDALNRSTGQTIDPDGLKLQSKKSLNKAGKITSRIDANGNVTRLFYDLNDRKRFVVDAAGGISEREYDAAGNIQCKRIYAACLTEAELKNLKDETSLEALLAVVKPKRTIDDSVKWKFYNKNGQSRFQVNIIWNDKEENLEGIVQETFYDLAGRRVGTTCYMDHIAVTNIDSLHTLEIEKRVEIARNVAEDQTVYYILDAAGQERFIIDAEGYVTEQRFNPMGQVIEKIIYANRVTQPQELAKLKPENVLAKITLDLERDSYSYFVFDSLSRPYFAVTAEGAVSKFFHDESGNLICEHHFYNRIKMPQPDYQALQNALNSLKEDENDRIIKKGYDKVDRQDMEIDAEKQSELYVLNALGERLQLIDKNKATWKVTVDAAGRPEYRNSPSVVLTHVVRNDTGQLESSASSAPTSVVEKTVYDKLRNPKVIITALGLPDMRTIEFDYNSRNLLTMTTVKDVSIDDGSTLNPKQHQYRPEKKITVTQRIVYNAKKLKIVETDEAGNSTFFVYDELMRPLYEIKPNGAVTRTDFDAANNEVRTTRYANPLTIDLRTFADKGLSRSMVEISLKPDVNHDLYTEKMYDRRGDVKQLRRGPAVLYCSAKPMKDGERQPVNLQRGFAETNFEYNALRKPIKETKKLDAERTATHLSWTDRVGNIVVECEALEKVDGIVLYRPSHYVLNTFGEHEEERQYEGKIKEPANLSLSQLEQALALIKSDGRDRHKQTRYNKNGLFLTQKILGALFHEPVINDDRIPHMRKMQEDLTVSYGRSPTGKIRSITHEDGHTEYKFYDQRDYLIAETGVPCTHPERSGEVQVPLTMYGIDAFGKVVRITNYKQGTKPVDASTAIPVPIDPNNEANQYLLELYDARGLILAKQDAMRNVVSFTRTATRQLARQWQKISNWDLNRTSDLIIRLDEKYFHQDQLGETIGVEIRRDGVTTEQTWTQKDIFGRSCAEGDAPDQFYIFRKFDALNHVWFTNEEKGANTIVITDLSGNRTLQLRHASTEPDKDLSKVEYAQIETLLKWKDIEELEITRDIAGRMIARTDPIARIPNPDAQSMLPLNMFIETTAENKTLLSWPVPQEANLSPVLYLFPSKDKRMGPFSEAGKTVTKKSERYYLDVSAFPTDVYTYTIEHSLAGATKPAYVTQGVIQFDTHNNQNSLNVVSTIQNNSVLMLAGNVAGLTAVELWQDGKRIQSIPLQVGQTQVDLRDYTSGVYQIKPIKSGQAEIPLSMDLVIYTSKPAKAPLSREIDYSVTLITKEKNIELRWQVPSFLQNKIVNLRLLCENKAYVNYELFLWLPGVVLEAGKLYVRINGVNLEYTVLDPAGVAKVGTILAGVLPCKIEEPLLDKLKPCVDDLLKITAKRGDTIDKIKEMNVVLGADSPSINFTFDFEIKSINLLSMSALHARMSAPPEDPGISLYENAIPITTTRDPESGAQHFVFEKRRILYIVPGIEFATTDDIHYLDTSLDLLRTTKTLSIVSKTPEGFTVDITSFAPGVYPFKMTSQENYTQGWALRVTHGGLVFPQPPEIAQDVTISSSPASSYVYDNFDNPITEINSRGGVITRAFDHRNKQIERVDPEVDIYNQNGRVEKRRPPGMISGFNRRGFAIGTTDQNGGTDLWALNEAGHY